MDPVAAAARLGAELLRPQAEIVDRTGVPRSHVEALAAAGLLAVAGPADAGGYDAAPATMRAVAETLAAADTSTWFVWTQHHTPVRTLARAHGSPLRDELLPRLLRAELAGVGYTHLRRPGPPPLVAEPDGAGWRLSGEISWLTSWGLADWFCLGAQVGDDVVWVFDRLDGAAVEVEPLGLAAMAGTATVRVRLDGLAVPPDRVALVEPLAQWREADAARTPDVSPAVLGVCAEAVRLLRAGSSAEAQAAAGRLGGELDDLRAQAYALADGAGAVGARLEVRAAAHALALRATAAVVAAGGGRSMTLDQPAQRLARAAMFLLVQGQTAAVRAATLQALGGEVSAGPAPADG